jgi:hypothetical protein
VVASGMVSALPAPKELERRCQALAVLDAVLCSDPRWRYYAFDPASRPVPSVGLSRRGSKATSPTIHGVV